MRHFVFCLAILSIFSTAALAGDDQPIKDRLDEFQAAWNKDDAAAMAATMTEDASLINPVGVVANGRDEILKLISQEHATMFKGTKYTISDVKVQWITPDVAVADVTANVSGMKGPDGAAAPDYAHHVTWVFVKKDGNWLGAAARPYQFAPKPGDGK